MLCLEHSIIPSDWKRGLVVTLWKGKGDLQDCNNYRGVTLLSVPGKVFAQIIIDWVRHHMLEHQRPEQSGFTPKRSTIDRILALRVLTECRREFRQGLLAVYVDLCKAFDSVNRDALWRILGLRGVPQKLINLMSELHSGTESAVETELDAPQLDLSDILPRIQSIQVLKSVGASTHP